MNESRAAPGPMRTLICRVRALVLGFMIEQMPVCTRANEVAEHGSEFTTTLHRRDPSLFGAVPSAPHRPAQRRQEITEVLTILQQRILIGNRWGKNIFLLFFYFFRSCEGFERKHGVGNRLKVRTQKLRAHTCQTRVNTKNPNICMLPFRLRPNEGIMSSSFSTYCALRVRFIT